MGKVIDGIDIETGEVIDPTATATGAKIEEVRSDPKADERVRVMSWIWPKALTSFVDEEGGYLNCEVMNWHAGRQVQVALKFEFGDKKLSVFPNARRDHSIELPVKMAFDIGSLKAGEGVSALQVPDGPGRYKATYNFRKRIDKLAQGHVNYLQQVLYKVTMLTGLDAHMYTRLDHKVLTGESLVEEVIGKEPGYALTSKGEERLIYLYQSVLEEKTPAQIKEMIGPYIRRTL